MKCKACNREIPSESIFCLHCGEKVVKSRSKKREISVPKPRQLADGRWSAQVMVDGKRVTVSGASIKEYEAAARALKAGVIEVKEKRVQSLGAAIDAFLRDNDNLLDKSTMRSYKSYRRNRFQGCMGWNIWEENPWQKAINEESSVVAAKTVRNAWGLITSALAYSKAPRPDVKLPRKRKVERPWLDYKQIEKFLAAVRDEPFELGALLALHSLRLSELIAVTPDKVDLKRGELKVQGSRVMDENGKVVYKELNKTDASFRTVPFLIPRLRELLTPEVMGQEYIADFSEKRLYDYINRVCRKAGLPPVGVHGLRHSFASLAYHLGWTKKSTMTVGGWTNSKVVDEIYTHNADLERDVKRMRKYYEKVDK